MIGIGASSGLSSGRIYKYTKQSVTVVNKDASDPDNELQRFGDAVHTVEEELKAVSVDENLDEEIRGIFGAHLEILRDPEMTSSVKTLIQDDHVTAEYAVRSVCDTFIAMFEAIEDEYISARAADIKDISDRIVKSLLGVVESGLKDICQPVILMAKDLTPSETVQLNKNFILGFITEIGGRTSHSAIMARSMEIPAVVGLGSSYEEIHTDDYVLMNGDTGEITVNPDEAAIEDFKTLQNQLNEQKEIWARYINRKSLTADNEHIDIAANIGGSEEVHHALERGAEGIGLFRTEFLYMGKERFPDEETQFKAYSEVLRAMGDKPVIIRTLDIGGDKELDYFDMPKEMNPFLGNRALRLCMANVDIFKVQLRALLRASVDGNLHIMLPMVATIDELRQAKTLIRAVEQALVVEGVKVDSYKVGIMIEIPAAVMVSDQLAKEVDFFSIGTNDLIQYTFAADRMNDQISYLYQPYNPSLLRMIDMVVRNAHKEDVWVGVCGEMGGEAAALPLLVGLGVDELSMSAANIPKSRYLLSQVDKTSARALVSKALQCENQEQVMTLTESYMGGK